MDEALVLVSLREHPTGVPQHQSKETGPNPLLPEPDEAGAPVRLPLLARGGLENQGGLPVPAAHLHGTALDELLEAGKDLLAGCLAQIGMPFLRAENAANGLDVRAQHTCNDLLGRSLFGEFQNCSVFVSTDHLSLQRNVLLESVGHFDETFHGSLPCSGSGGENSNPSKGDFYIPPNSVLSRIVKRMEENLYFAGRDLFTPAPDLLFFDTTSVYFEGKGPTGGLGQYYYSKDNRPDRKQMIVGVVLTREGTPLAHHVFPGNTPDAAAFSVVIEEMRNRFGIQRVILVGDRGMFNASVIKRIEELEMEYIAGVRMRTVWDVREIVLEDKAPFETVSENLKVKKVELGGETYVVCLNEEEAKRAKGGREKGGADTRGKVAKGPKKLGG